MTVAQPGLDHADSAACVACRSPLEYLRPYKFKSSVFRQAYSSDIITRCVSCGLQQADMHHVDDVKLGEYYRTQYRTVAKIGGGDAGFVYRPRARALTALAREWLAAAPTRIFEVGAGHGINLSALGEAFPDAALLTDEVDQSVSLPPRIRAASLDDGPYDLIVMSHVLEHFSDPQAFLDRAAAALSPDGVLLIEVPNDPPAALDNQLYNEPHLLFFEPKTLRNLVGRSVTVLDAFQVGPPPGSGPRPGSFLQRIKSVARRMPVFKSILDRRRAGRELDVSTRREQGGYLRIIAGKASGPS